MPLKLAGKILDFTDDPDFVGDRKKMALIEGKMLPFDKHASLPNDAFALLIQGKTGLFRRYPVYSKVATHISAEYFDDNHDQLPPVLHAPVATAIKKACSYWGIEPPKSIEKNALGDKLPANRILKAAELTDHHDVTYQTKEAAYDKLTSQYMARFREMDTDERVERATVLSKMAAKLGREMPKRVEDYAAKKTFGPLFKRACLARVKHMMKTKRDKIAVAELFHMVKDASPAEAVNALEVYDNKYNLRDNYSNFYDPAMAVYGNQKVAIVPMGTPEDDLTSYALQSVMKQYHDELTQKLTQTGMDQLRADPKMFYDTASPAVKKMLDKMMKSVNDRSGEAIEYKDLGIAVGGNDRSYRPSGGDYRDKKEPTHKKVDSDQVNHEGGKGDGTLNRNEP